MPLYRLTPCGKDEVQRSGLNLGRFFHDILSKAWNGSEGTWNRFRAAGVPDNTANTIITAINKAKCPYRLGEGTVTIVFDTHVEVVSRAANKRRTSRSESGADSHAREVNPTEDSQVAPRDPHVQIDQTLPLTIDGGNDAPSTPTFELMALMIDELLRSPDGAKVLGFHQQHCPTAIVETNQGWVVAPQFRHGEGNVSEVLRQISEQIRAFQGASWSDWRNLLNVVGGFLTFAIDPTWVEQQRSAEGNIRYPSEQREITFRDNETAHLMHLLTAAIAQGFPRLNRIFERESSEKHELVGPDIEEEIVESQRIDELKRSIIRDVQHVNSIPKNVRELSGSRLQKLFKETQAMIQSANRRRDPYFTWHKAYLDAVAILRSPEFGLRDLLLIFAKDEGLPIDLISECSKPAAWLFEYTHDIYQVIRQHLPLE